MGRDGPLLLALVVAFAAAVFLSAAETSLIRVPMVRAMSHAGEGRRSGNVLVRLLEDLPRVLGAILLAALLAQIGAATVTGILAQRWFGNVGITVASVVLTLLLFVYGEAIPKTYAVRHADRVAVALARPVAVMERLLRPVVTALIWVADLQTPGPGVTTSPTITEEELRRLAGRAAVEGEITEADRALIERVFRFGDRRADEIMVPRPDIVAVPTSATVKEAMGVMLEAGHRRLPVFAGDVENVIGVVTLRDLVRARETGAATPVGTLAARPFVVPESKRIFELLEDMRRHRTHFAVVVDEFGDTAGLVTIEDVAEELLGDISKEAGAPAVDAVAEDHWFVDGGLPVEDLEQLLDLRLPRRGWNTAAGLIMGVAGRLLAEGDEVDVEGRRMRVAQTRGRRITRIEVLPPDD